MVQDTMSWNDELGHSREVQEATIQWQQRASAAGAATQPQQPPLGVRHHTAVQRPVHPQVQRAARAEVLLALGGSIPPRGGSAAPLAGQAAQGVVKQPRTPANQQQATPSITAHLAGPSVQPTPAQLPATPSPPVVQQPRRCVPDLAAPPNLPPLRMPPPGASATAGGWAGSIVWI
jgi:hypothetical protein